MSRLFLDVNAGDSVEIDGPAKVTIKEKTGRKTRLEINADRDVRIKHVQCNGADCPEKNPKLRRA